MSSSLEDQLVSYVHEHAENGILLDTNVLLLLLVARFKPDLVGGKRLEIFGLRDAELLTTYVKNFSRILTTSHVLAETSNFARQIMTGRTQAAFFAWLHPMFCTEGEDSLAWLDRFGVGGFGEQWATAFNQRPESAYCGCNGRGALDQLHAHARSRRITVNFVVCYNLYSTLRI